MNSKIAHKISTSCYKFRPS